MRYPILLAADLHLTSNVRDEYRWKLFTQMREHVKERGIRTVCLLGDLSDSKDFHPSSLVNRIAREIYELSQLCRVYMIPGNHEWLKRGEEFWRFLPLVSDRVHYFTAPSDDPHPDKDGPVVRFLPFTKTPGADWAGHDFSHYNFVFMHQTVRNSVSSNGQEMDGEDVPLDALAQAGKVYSGDIHVPQKVGCVEYVGSPYHVHFGDKFKPRLVLLTGKTTYDSLNVRYPNIHRVTIDATDLEAVASWAHDLESGDQVKLRMHLAREEQHEWKRVKREAMAILRSRGLEIHGLELVMQKDGGRRRLGSSAYRGGTRSLPTDDVLRYVRAEELGPDALDAGLEVIGQ